MDFATFLSKAEEKLKNELISCTIMPNSFYEQRHNRILLAMRCLVVLSHSFERRKKKMTSNAIFLSLFATFLMENFMANLFELSMRN